MLFLKVACENIQKTRKHNKVQKVRLWLDSSPKNDKYSKGLIVKYVLSKGAAFSREGVRVVHPVTP